MTQKEWILSGLIVAGISIIPLNFSYLFASLVIGK